MRGSIIWSAKRDLDRAISEYEKAIRIDQNSIDAYLVRGSAFFAKRDFEPAEKDFSAAIEINPKSALAYSYRAVTHERLKNYAAALVDWRRAAQLQPAATDYQNGFAWYLATCPDDKVRCGRESVKIATKACQASEWKNHWFIDTLACALAETGQFGAAILRMQQALQLVDRADEVNRKLYEARIAQFKQRQPCREAPDKRQAKE